MKKVILAVLIYSLLPSSAWAHELAGGAGGFWAGLDHPVFGFDHLLAMLSVGILSAQMGGRAIWSVPLTFVAIMLLAGIAGIFGLPLFSVELGIACSVLLLGIALFVEKKLPPILAMLFVGFFAIFHGHAHGTEIPSLASPLLYACGFIVGTTAIHIAGVWFGHIAGKFNYGDKCLRYVGASIACAGLYLIPLSLSV